MEDDNDLEYTEGMDIDESSVMEQDVDGVCRTLKEAWKILPKLSLGQLLDITMVDAFEMSDEEIIDALNDFIHQNE